jgi:tetratricopeptide (TPR) repeat protein
MLRGLGSRKSVVGLLLLLLLSACGPAQGNSGQEIDNAPGAYTFSEGKTSYPHLYQQAIDHLERNEYRAAEAIYRDLIDNESGNASGYIGLGTALFLQDRFEEAQAAYAKALDIAPDSVDALIGLGSASHRQGEAAKASDYYARALEIEPDNPQALWGLATNLELMGQREKAIEHLERIVELSPDSGLAAEAVKRIREIRADGE